MSKLIKWQKCEVALPQTIGSISASVGFVTGSEAGCWIGGLLAGFASDSGRLRHGVLVAGMGGVALGCGALGAGVCYALGFGGSNLLMKAFPSIQQKELPLIGVGRKPKVALFMCCASMLGCRRLQVNGLLSKKRWSQ
jgi:hypothetical protein